MKEDTVTAKTDHEEFLKDLTLRLNYPMWEIIYTDKLERQRDLELKKNSEEDGIEIGSDEVMGILEELMKKKTLTDDDILNLDDDVDGRWV